MSFLKKMGNKINSTGNDTRFPLISADDATDGKNPANKGADSPMELGKQTTSPETFVKEGAAPKVAGVTNAFNMLYGMLAAVGVMIFVVASLFQVMMLLKTIMAELKQRKTAMVNTQSFTYEACLEQKLFSYLNAKKTEGINVYTSYALIKALIAIMTTIVILVFTHMGMFMSMLVYAEIKEIDFQDKFEINVRAMFIVLILLFLVIVFMGTYKALIQKKFTDSVRKHRAHFMNVRNYLYENFTTDEGFLKGMLNDGDLPMMQVAFSRATSEKRSDDCTSAEQNCDGDAGKMMFTYCVYEYMRTLPNMRKKLDEIFTVEGIRTEDRHKPLELYFLYDQLNNVGNLYESGTWGKYFKPVHDATATKNDTMRESIFINNLSAKLKKLNMMLQSMREVKEVRGPLYTYLTISTILFICTGGAIVFALFDLLKAFIGRMK